MPKQNSHALAEGLEKLLTDDELYKKMSAGAREIFNSAFTSKAMTENTENYYKEIIGGKNNAR